MKTKAVRKGVYIPEEIMRDMELQAARLDRTVSWLVQRAWMLARERIAEYPSLEELDQKELQ